MRVGAAARRVSTSDAAFCQPSVYLATIRAQDEGRHSASTASVYFLVTKQLRDSGLPADVLAGKLNKDISFAFPRGTIAQVT